MAGNIIQVNGEKNSGKTALLLNIAKANMTNWNVHYFNSEMDAGELRLRLSKFRHYESMDMWDEVNFYSRSGGFGDVIFSGEGNLNIIDFLEIHNEFYKAGLLMKEIHDRLKGAIAVVAVQKNYGQEMGVGGSRTEEKPRLILNLSNGKIKIKMAKNWKTENPNGMVRDFKLADGNFFKTTSEWYEELK